MSSMLNGSHIIKGRWKILRKIGQGAFGTRVALLKEGQGGGE
jgi:hypothetical protein